jgi:hypothetical protein
MRTIEVPDLGSFEDQLRWAAAQGDTQDLPGTQVWPLEPGTAVEW